MTNNDIFKKLRVALMLRDEDILNILTLVDFKISKSELSALFRKENHPNYVECGDQILRNFLNGLVIYLRGTREDPKYPGEVLNSGIKEKNPLAQNKKQHSKRDYKKKAPGDVSYVKYKNKKKS